MSKNLWWLFGGVVAYYLYTKRDNHSNSGVSGLSGLGVGGTPRRGNPKTDEERKASHAARFGNENLPPRGTGLRRR